MIIVLLMIPFLLLSFAFRSAILICRGLVYRGPLASSSVDLVCLGLVYRGLVCHGLAHHGLNRCGFVCHGPLAAFAVALSAAGLSAMPPPALALSTGASSAVGLIRLPWPCLPCPPPWSSFCKTPKRLGEGGVSATTLRTYLGGKG